jgi:hypothetical protein
VAGRRLAGWPDRVLSRPALNRCLSTQLQLCCLQEFNAGEDDLEELQGGDGGGDGAPTAVKATPAGGRGVGPPPGSSPVSLRWCPAGLKQVANALPHTCRARCCRGGRQAGPGGAAEEAAPAAAPRQAQRCAAAGGCCASAHQWLLPWALALSLVFAS